MSQVRQPEHPVSQIFLDRWSPRAFTGEAIKPEELLTFLEAARWAPSAFNAQPWRFVYALAGTPAWDTLFPILVPFNQGWAQRASALVIVLSAKTSVAPGATEAKPNPSHSFDTGAAWAQLALQATISGWHAHGMTGIDKDLARTSLGVPEDFDVEAAVAIGRLSQDKSALAEGLRARDVPSPRLPLGAIAAEGRFGFQG